jgi:hypothetical protein
MNVKQRKQRIVGAGLPRTGTWSLAAALEKLGWDPVLHAHTGNAIKIFNLTMLLSFL